MTLRLQKPIKLLPIRGSSTSSHGPSIYEHPFDAKTVPAP